MKKPKILVVDDEIDMLEIVAFWLKADFTVLTAGSGSRGIALAIENEPDLILSDVMMPGVDGVEFLTKVKEAKVRTRFVFMTAAFKNLRDTVKFIKLGACDVIHKPFERSELLVTVNRALALDSALALHVSNPAPIFHEVLAELAKIERDRKELLEQVEELRRLRRAGLWETVLVRSLYLAAAATATTIFYRVGMIERGVALFALPGVLFVLLSLPFDRIKTLIAKVKKTESRATFK